LGVEKSIACWPVGLCGLASLLGQLPVRTTPTTRMTDRELERQARARQHGHGHRCWGRRGLQSPEFKIEESSGRAGHATAERRRNSGGRQIVGLRDGGNGSAARAELLQRAARPRRHRDGAD
jgi:hypothetical protein